MQRLGSENGQNHHEKTLTNLDEIPSKNGNNKMIDIGKHITKTGNGIPSN